jgi:galactose mutarotase-like enzyme
VSAAPATFLLTAGAAELEVAPGAGARLMRWNVAGRPVLHWPAAADWAQPARIRGGNPLLFPFIARTFLDGRMGSWRGPDGVVRPAPMHGLVRAACFEVDSSAADRITMRIASDAAMAVAYPFPFVFLVEYVLGENELTVAFTVENTGAEPLPWSVGNHFYFAVRAAERGAWRLECPCRHLSRQNETGAIVSAPPLAPGGTLADPDLVDLFHVGPPRQGVMLRHLDDGRAVLFDLEPDDTGRDAWYAVTTWTESPHAGFYCVEPWTALPDAVHNGQGLRWLKPGTRETLRLRLRTQGW